MEMELQMREEVETQEKFEVCLQGSLTSREISLPFQLTVSSLKGARPSLSVVRVWLMVPFMP